MRKRSSPTHSRRRRGAARTRLSTPTPGLSTGVVMLVLGFFLVLLIWGISSAHSTSALSPLQQKLLQQQRAAGRAQLPSITSPETPVPPAQPTPPRQAGIIIAPQTPFSPAIFTARNAWQGPVGSQWVMAYAGAQTNPDGTPGRGGLLLYTVGDFALEYVGTFLAPAGTTTLTIIQLQGDLLRLQAASGQRLTFNLQSQQYQ